MSPEAAFLRAIIETPYDDSLRLVFADWLEEHGQSARADFIRVQVERASLLADDPRQAALKKREVALRLHNEDIWRKQLPKWKGVVWGSLRRGFVDEVTVSGLRHYQSRADAMFAAAPIVDLKCHGFNAVDCQEMMKSPYLRRLHGLTFIFCAVGDKGAKAIAECGSLKTLRKLRLCARPHGSRSQLLVLDAGGLALAASPHLENLEHLDLRYNAFSGNAKQALRARFGERVVL
jgi:uncharacterized protein (TIGR02996 family)